MLRAHTAYPCLRNVHNVLWIGVFFSLILSILRQQNQIDTLCYAFFHFPSLTQASILTIGIIFIALLCFWVARHFSAQSTALCLPNWFLFFFLNRVLERVWTEKRKPSLEIVIYANTCCWKFVQSFVLSFVESLPLLFMKECSHHNFAEGAMFVRNLSGS